MKTTFFLTFVVGDITYGIEASLVKEIFLLPEITPMAETPVDIVGILNLRGKIVPIMHLDLRLGNAKQSCTINDSVIILNCKNLQIGLIVNQVNDVKNIDSHRIESTIDYGRINSLNPTFIAGIATLEAEDIILLNPQALIRQPDAVEALVEDTNQPGNDDTSFEQLISNNSQKNLTITGKFYDIYCPDATSEEREIFRLRCENLKQANTEKNSDLAKQIPLAVIGMSGEYFGVNLGSVREFINIRNVTPIPCCPSHIIGNINLRGEIVTLVDIRGTLNLETSIVKTGTKAVVIKVDDIVAGLPIDDVLDMMYLPPQNITAVPLAADFGDNTYLEGTASYSEKILSILDLQKLLTKGNLAVNEEV
ncbi:chemotaxis protein CheW [Aphanothece sacrum]|uniref:Chemotaxis signal transduction protein n=1 Tax=Aphanothece sacrum FPU1 TaxID=1920663 RepID=A0A401IHM2_APHSA|nr:chemotaxis protein CheW [Aphanothece sacrum]GBF80768.1 chemotaxis signal transduction protein [Aphanothece sacrum FPU1]GBF83263.1 chemotaxis signal transduction protein [Aphanothece sacrum FPU3]